MTKARVYPGDLVEVRKPAEILATLDADGTLERLPFMPEMIGFCGQRFRVSKRAVKVCFTGPKSSPRSFKADDVVLLEDLRCSGADHDGCQKACAILWPEAWLRKVVPANGPTGGVSDGSDPGVELLRGTLRMSQGEGRYFCQASELLNATEHLSRLGRYRSCVREVRARNCGPITMLSRISRFAFWKVRRKLFGVPLRGSRRQTPRGSLGLRAGESVEVKPIEAIVATLDRKVSNRGLYFMPGMSGMCSRGARVADRIDRIIVDGTGEMRELRDTVRLENSVCECAYLTVGGCSRGEIAYWRELWLDRAPTVDGAEGSLS